MAYRGTDSGDVTQILECQYLAVSGLIRCCAFLVSPENLDGSTEPVKIKWSDGVSVLSTCRDARHYTSLGPILSINSSFVVVDLKISWFKQQIYLIGMPC